MGVRAEVLVRISTAKRDGCVTAEGTVDEVIGLVLALSRTDVLKARWTMVGGDNGVAINWPLGEPVGGKG